MHDAEELQPLSHPDPFADWVRVAEGQAVSADQSPIEELLAEHHLMSAVLAAMDAAGARMNRGEPMEIALWRNVVEFIDVFVHRCHRKKEENVLFPAAVAGGWIRPEQSTALGREHQQARELTERLAELAAAGDWEGVVRLSSLYMHVLRPHMRREEEGLEQAAVQIHAEALTELRRGFDAVESAALGEGGRERYRSLAQSICAQAGVAASWPL